MADVVVCEWFALCTRPAEYDVKHPILGTVPTCGPCVETLGLHRDAERSSYQVELTRRETDSEN